MHPHFTTLINKVNSLHKTIHSLTQKIKDFFPSLPHLCLQDAFLKPFANAHYQILTLANAPLQYLISKKSCPTRFCSGRSLLKRAVSFATRGSSPLSFRVRFIHIFCSGQSPHKRPIHSPTRGIHSSPIPVTHKGDSFHSPSHPFAHKIAKRFSKTKKGCE